MTLIVPQTIFNNLALNSRMEIAQDPSLYPVDMWHKFQSGTMVVTQAQASSGIAGFTKSLKFTVTTAEASLGVNEHFSPFTGIDGYRANGLQFGTSNGVGFTVAFMARSSIAMGTTGIGIQNSNSNRTYVATYSLAANTDTLVIMNIPPDSGSGWNLTSASTPGIYLVLGLAAGTNRQTTPNVWTASGTPWTPTGQTNWVATIGNTFEITGFVVVPTFPALQTGSLQLLCRDYNSEMQLCRSIYENSFGASPAAFTQGNGKGTNFSSSAAVGTFTVPFQTPKVIVPTVTVYDIAGTSGKISTAAAGVWTNGRTPAAGPTPTVDRFYIADTTAGATNCEFGWKADCAAAW